MMLSLSNLLLVIPIDLKLNTINEINIILYNTSNPVVIFLKSVYATIAKIIVYNP